MLHAHVTRGRLEPRQRVLERAEAAAEEGTRREDAPAVAPHVQPVGPGLVHVTERRHAGARLLRKQGRDDEREGEQGRAGERDGPAAQSRCAACREADGSEGHETRAQAHDAAARERDGHGQHEHGGRTPGGDDPHRATAVEPAQPLAPVARLVGEARGQAEREAGGELDVACEVVLADEGAERRDGRHVEDAEQLVAEQQPRHEPVNRHEQRAADDERRRAQQRGA